MIYLAGRVTLEECFVFQLYFPFTDSGSVTQVVQLILSELLRLLEAQQFSER